MPHEAGTQGAGSTINQTLQQGDILYSKLSAMLEQAAHATTQFELGSTIGQQKEDVSKNRSARWLGGQEGIVKN